jgi:hypothetical protein
MNARRFIRRRVTALAMPALLGAALTMHATTHTPAAKTAAPRSARLAAAAPKAHLTAAQLKARYARYRERLNSLHAAHKTEAQIAATIEREFDIVKLSHAGARSLAGRDITLATNGTSDVYLYTPSMSYDRYVGHYVMAATYTWNSCSHSWGSEPCWTNDKNSSGNIGGYDGFALKTYPRPISRRDQGITTSNNCNSVTGNYYQPSTGGSYGVSFKLQDTVSNSSAKCAGTYYRNNMHFASMSETFDFQTNCVGVQIQTESILAHSWDTTSLTSIGINVGKDGAGFSVSWQTTGHQWQVLPRYPGYSSC